MIDALVGGSLVGTPQEKTGASGKTYVQAKLRVPVADGEVLFVLLTGFDPEVRRALLAHASGDSVAVSGPLKLGTWTPPQGSEARVNVSMVVQATVSAYAVKRRRAAVQDAKGGQPPRESTRSTGARQPAFHDDPIDDL